MFLISRSNLLLFWYCILNTTCLLAVAEECPSAGSPVVEKLPAGFANLIQRRYAPASALQAKQNVTQSGLSLLSQQSQNRTTAADAIDNPHPPHEHDDKVHHSIFEMSFAQLDRSFFWFVFACMLVFTIFVDKAEAFAQRSAERSPSNQKFLTRVNAELMMFGCVGLFLFVLGNVTDLPHEQELILEFVDILCSMGACGLMVIAAILIVARHWEKKKYKELETVHLLEKDIEPSGPLEVGFFRRFFRGSSLTPMDYQVMAARFLKKHRLPKDFLYSDYMDETFVGNACQLMDVKWYTWFSVLVVVLCFLVLRTVRGTHFPNTVYIMGFLVANWLMFFSFLVLVMVANDANMALVREIREDEAELQAAGIKIGHHLTERAEKPSHPLNDKWSWRMKFAMQLVSLMNSFLCSFYVMHLQFNLQAAGMTWWWRPLLLFPLLVSLFVMLPVLISTFTAAEAFFTPDGDAMEVAEQQITQLDEDFDAIRKMWEGRDNKTFPQNGDKGCDEAGLGLLLREMDIHISKARLHRIFHALDVDKSGDVTLDELTSKLENKLLELSSSMSQGVGSFCRS